MKRQQKRLIRISIIAALAIINMYHPFIEPESDTDKAQATTETQPDQASQQSDSAAVPEPTSQAPTITLDQIPAYDGAPYVTIADNQPAFSDEDMQCTDAFANYSPLDELGRCGVCYANVCTETMPTEERGEIGQVKPSGWHTVNYHELIDGNYLYNRCHLIGYQLTGENANVCNLITGTRYLNVEGMLPFENEVADYVTTTGNHVLYRVTPIYEGDNIVASGVQMEAYSVEDSGQSICFNVYCYNVQPGIIIDYATGDSQAEQPI